jgi:hypothetical protein
VKAFCESLPLRHGAKDPFGGGRAADVPGADEENFGDLFYGHEFFYHVKLRAVSVLALASGNMPKGVSSGYAPYVER